MFPKTFKQTNQPNSHAVSLNSLNDDGERFAFWERRVRRSERERERESSLRSGGQASREFRPEYVRWRHFRAY